MTELPTDSVGQPWAGKTIPSHGFAGDSGDADLALVAALARLQARPDPDAEVGLWRAWLQRGGSYPSSRSPTEVDELGRPRHRDPQRHGGRDADLTGRPRALPVFSRWSPRRVGPGTARAVTATLRRRPRSRRSATSSSSIWPRPTRPCCARAWCGRSHRHVPGMPATRRRTWRGL